MRIKLFRIFALLVLTFSLDVQASLGDPVYRCAHLEEDSPLEGVQIFRSGSNYFAVFRFLNSTGEFIERTSRMTLSRLKNGEVEKLVFSGNGLTVDVVQSEPIEPGKLQARIYVRELALQTEYAACKAF